MDDDVRRIGAFHDVARPGALLRRPRPRKKRPVRAGAMSRHRWAGHHSLVDLGYSLVFSRGSPLIGGLKFAFLHGVDSQPNSDYSYWVSQNVFAMYQLMFAIITPALIIGAMAERMKFAAMLVFVGLWMFLVYFPIAHMVWGMDGWMNGVWNPTAKITAIDFAGGTVVHMSSGWSALVLCILLGHRLGFRKEIMAPHSMVLCMVGTGMLWVGWYGFNAGSALAPDGIAANAFMTTTLATAVASLLGHARYALAVNRACSVSVPERWPGWSSLPLRADMCQAAR